MISPLYELTGGDEDARACRDIPDSACRVQPRNFLVHLLANTATKIGDELASPRLVLAWLLGALGAPAALTGLLVPIREAGALLPQLVVAGLIRRRAVRKGFWVSGSLIQGAAVLAMAAVAATLEGAAAGWAVVGLLVVFSLARGVCSVASKDVLGKTIAKARRGRVMGYASAAAGVTTVLAGIWLRLTGTGADTGALVTLLLIAGGLWLAGAGIFATLREYPGATEGGVDAWSEALASLGLLRRDRVFRHFVITRTLLLSTALSVPYYALLARAHTGGDVTDLGLLIIASGLAAAVSAPLWGRLADRSARRVLILAPTLAGVLGLLVFAGARGDWAGLDPTLILAAAFLLLGAAHSGVRLGRKTYLVDLATADNRAAYVAVSNTVIGAMLLVGSLFGLLAQAAGPAVTVGVLALVALAAAASATRLPEVE